MMKNYQVTAKKIRDIIINQAAKGNMHLSSGLGVVELCIALFEVFDFHTDKLIFDIGHQRFPYLVLLEKYLRGQLRFPIGLEKYDMFSYPGFVGLSVASALGYALTYPKYKAIAVIGDGALTCGEVFESLNQVGALQSNVLVILNQNGQSITDNVGALTNGNMRQFANSMRFEYIGLINGHDTNKLIKKLVTARDKKHPVFLHIKTIKGKGYIPAEHNPMKFHRPTVSFDKITGEFVPKQQLPLTVLQKSMKILEKKGANYIKKYKKVYFTVPACPVFSELARQFPQHVIDTGINEQHCMTLSTSLAAFGNKVIMCLIGPFLSRCYSQVYDLCHQQAPLTIVFQMSGVNTLGSTHQAVYTMAALKIVPNLVIMHAANLAEYETMLDYAINLHKPVFLQVPKENYIHDVKPHKITYGCGTILKVGTKLTILPIGSMFTLAFTLANKYDGVEIINPRFIKPFDYVLLKKSIKKTGHLLILEDGFKQGGIGEEVISYLREQLINCKVKYVAANNVFPKYEDYELAKNEYNLSMKACEQAVNELLQ